MDDIKRQLLEEKARRATIMPHKYYVPTGAGEEFINKLFSGKYFVTLYSAANGVGKCKPLTSKILMADGSYKDLGDIKVGDIVLGHNYSGDGVATPSKVYQVSRAGKKDVYRFIFKDGGFVDASPEHKFPVKVRSGRSSKIVKKTVQELLDYKQKYVGGSIKFQQPKAIEFINKKELPIDPYLMGCLLGDGCLRDNGLKFSSIDKGIIDRLQDILTGYGLSLTHRVGCDYDITINNFYNYGNFNSGNKNILKESLKKYGLISKKSGDKFIPDDYKTCSIRDRKLLLAGLIDTDGTNKEYLTKSKKLADDFCFLVKSVGGKAIMHEKIVNNNFTKHEDKLYYRVYWAFDFELPLTLKRKQKLSKRPVEYSNRFVKEIQYLGKLECGDIFINHPDHCYISDDFISTGNTWSGANILANLMFPCGNKWFDGLPLYDNWPYPKKGRIVADPNTIVETIIPNLKTVFPKGRYTTNKMGKSYEYHFETDTGWEFNLMTYEQEAKEFESATLGWVWMDEPPPENIYKANISRLRKGGILFITATPLTGSAWMYDHIICNVNHEQGERTFVNADVESACIEHGVRGFLRHKDIERMISEYSEDEKQARIKGMFQHLTGLIYKQWNRTIHVIKPFVINKKDYVVINMLDPHPRNPNAVAWIAIDRNGRKFYVDELFIPVDSTEEFAARVKEKDEKYRVIAHYADPSAFVTNQNSDEKCLADRLSGYGLTYLPATKRREDANKRLGDALNYVKIGEAVIKPPELLVFDTCSRFIYEVEHWRWDEWKGKMKDDRNSKEKPIDKDDHEIENVGRCLLQEPYFLPMINNYQQNLSSFMDDGIIRDEEFDPYF